MGVELFILIMIAFMFIGSLVATESNDLLSSVIAIGAVGFGLAVIDLLAGAPDLAFPQMVVEVVALVLLIRVVVTRRERKEERLETPRDALRIGVVLLAAGVLLVAVFLAVGGFVKPVEAGTGAVAVGASDKLPPVGKPVLAHDELADPVSPGVSRDYLEGSVRDTGASNAVMAILLDYRAYDTLGEATIIFVSILGAYVLLRKVGRQSREESRERKEVSQS